MIGRHDDDKTTDGSSRVDTDKTVTGRHAVEPTGTQAGADVHSRMTGTAVDADPHQGVEHRVVPARTKPAKTSAAAVFGLVFGLAALFCALTAILSPAAVVFGILGLVLSIAGLKMAKRLGVTGRGVAIGGLVTSLLGLVLGAAVLAGAAAIVNDEARLDQLQDYIDDVRENGPSTDELRDELPG